MRGPKGTSELPTVNSLQFQDREQCWTCECASREAHEHRHLSHASEAPIPESSRRVAEDFPGQADRAPVPDDGSLEEVDPAAWSAAAEIRAEKVVGTWEGYLFLPGIMMQVAPVVHMKTLGC